MVIEGFEQKVFLVIASIPTGRVATYGQIAALSGLPGRARLVGRVLSQLPDDTLLPWHRVVNATGKISLPKWNNGHQVQKRRLQCEGVEIVNDRIKLKDYRWDLMG